MYLQNVTSNSLNLTPQTALTTVSDLLKKLLIRMLAVKMNERMTIQELCGQPFIAIRLPTVAKVDTKKSLFGRLFNQPKQELITTNFDSLDDNVLLNVIKYLRFEQRMMLIRTNTKWGVMVKTLNRHKEESLLATIDETILVRILYYVSFRDRVKFELVNKKWRDVLVRVWETQECLSIGIYRSVFYHLH